MIFFKIVLFFFGFLAGWFLLDLLKKLKQLYVSGGKSQVKVFQMNDCDWYAGTSLEVCEFAICKDTGEKREDIVDGPFEVSREKMKTLKFVYENGKKTTFAKRLKEMVKEDSNQFPCFFASTEY